jgi:hypothetical protein
MLVTALFAAATLSAPPPALPGGARLVVKLDLAALADAPLVRKDAARWRAWADDWAKALAACGCPAGEVQQLWFAAGEDFPRGSELIAAGSFEPQKFEDRLNRQARDKRWGTRRWGDESPPMFSLELPVAANPIPGLPGVAYVSADDGVVVIGFDKDVVRAPRHGRESIAGEFAEGVVLAARLLPPPAVTGPGGLLAGIRQVKADVRMTDAAALLVELTPAEGTTAETVADQTRSFVDHVRKNFPLLAAQQGVNARFVALVGDVLAAAKVRVDGGRVTVAAEVPGDVVSKLIGR